MWTLKIYYFLLEYISIWVIHKLFIIERGQVLATGADPILADEVTLFDDVSHACVTVAALT